MDSRSQRRLDTWAALPMAAKVAAGGVTAAIVTARYTAPILHGNPRVRQFDEGPRAFGKNRPVGGPTDHQHAGVDIVTLQGHMLGDRVDSPVFGRVIAVGGWSGQNTRRIEIASAFGVVVIGAVDGVMVQPGDWVRPGQEIAKVGEYPNGDSMIHLELLLWVPRVKWRPGKMKPMALLNPTRFAKRITRQ